MKEYKVLSVSSFFSVSKLKRKTEKLIAEKLNEGFEIVSVSSGLDIFGGMTALITIRK